MKDEHLQITREHPWTRHYVVHSEHAPDVGVDTRTDELGFHWRNESIEDGSVVDYGFATVEELAIAQALASYEDRLPVPFRVAQTGIDAQVVSGVSQ